MEERITVWLVRPKDRPSWQGQWREKASGRVRTRSLGTADRAEAEKKRADLEYELSHGLAPASSAGAGPLSWEEFARRYDAERMALRRPRTREKAAWVFARFAREARPGRLASVDEAMIARHAARMRAGGLRPDTVAAHLSVLRAALRWAERQQLLPRAPRIDMPPLPAPPRRPVADAAGMARLLAAMPDARWRLLLRVAWFTGLRRGELLALAWDGDGPRADLAAGRITIPASHAKGGRDRWLPIHPALLGELRKVPPGRRKGLLFGLMGKSCPQDVSSEFGRCARAAGLPGVGLHGIRRSFATRYAPHVEAAVLMELMGHQDFRTTLRHYADLRPALEKAIRAA